MGKFNLKNIKESTNILNFVRECLPDISKSDSKKIYNKLKKLGVKKKEHFLKLKNKDLTKGDHITVVQARTLLSLAKDGELQKEI